MTQIASQRQENLNMPVNRQMPVRPVIVQIIPELGPGGAEQGTIDIAGEIVKSGARSIVISNGGPRAHELGRVGAEHIDLPVHSKNPLVMYQNIKNLRKIIQNNNVDIVHVRSRAPAWSAWKACEKTDAKFMTTCHAPYNIGDKKLKLFYNSIMAKGERVIAISNHVQNYLIENYQTDPNRIRLIHRGVQLDRFHPSVVAPAQLINLSKEWRVPDDASIVMLPGRITRWKGHHVLIDAMAKLNRKEIFCVLIGSDQGRKEYREELETAISEKGLEGQIRIIDHCNDMPAAYMISTVVVSASIDPEGFGRIPIEAQAMGRPIIATDHGGAQETIVRNETGWLIPPNNSTALAEAIGQAIDLTQPQKEMLSYQSMEHIAHNFSLAKMADETLNVYAELLHEKYRG